MQMGIIQTVLQGETGGRVCFFMELCLLIKIINYTNLVCNINSYLYFSSVQVHFITNSFLCVLCELTTF